MKVYERCVSYRLSVFMESEGDFPMHQYTYRKGLETCETLLDIVFAEQATLNRGREWAEVQIDYSAAFDRVGHSELLFKLRYVGNGANILNIFFHFVYLLLII